MQPSKKNDEKSCTNEPSAMKSVMGTSTVKSIMSLIPDVQTSREPPQVTCRAPATRKEKRRRKEDSKKSDQAPPETMTDRTVTTTTEKENLDAELRRELARGSPYKKVLVDFNYESGEYLGIEISSTLIVVKVDQRPGISPFWNKLLNGDVLKELSGTSIKNLDHFYETIRCLQSPITLVVKRPIRTKPVSRNRIRRLKINMSSGDRYLTAYTFYRPQAKLGISVKSYQNMVALLKVDEEGLGAGGFEIGDIILDIDGVPVKSTEEAKRSILTALQTKGSVSTVVMRPMTEQSLEMSKQILGSYNTSINPEMKIDAVLIGRTEAMRRKLDKDTREPAEGILIKASQHRPRNTRHSASIDATRNTDFEINSDVPPQEWAELAILPTRLEQESAVSNSKAKERFNKFKNFLITKFTR